MNTQRTSGGSVTEGLPRFALIDKDGKKRAEAALASDLILYAERLWPGEEQDETRSGKGWDIEAVR